MKTIEYNNFILACTQKIANLPQNEIKYHLLLAVSAVKDINNEFNSKFIEGMKALIEGLEIIMDGHLLSYVDKRDCYERILREYKYLTSLAQTETLTTKISHHLINLGAALLAFLLGTASGLIGGFAGLARGIWNLTNPLSSFATGVATGIVVGAAIGFRIPKKLFKDELIRQIKYCLDGIHECIDNLQQTNLQSFAIHKEKVKQKLLQDYFKNDQTVLTDFLQEEVAYEINTFQAQFISPSLEGYLGHHAFIKIIIDTQKPPLTIEFSTGETDLQRPVTQYERRFVSGEKIVEMLAIHEQLKVTHATMKYILTKMKPGEKDCFSYVDKVLIGTSQQATSVKRFNGTENWIGRNVVGFFIQKLSPFRQDMLTENQQKCGC
ncbi:hypothetical protein [Legionella brunensis]|uniref:Uncharacterized protein n=1 Tax=Legionella brunensis TaxID=29422 RepID=A0A0W0SDC4_9GAMM|nr:hypothetical protein [Legionella brunensis]KTC81480.1 hypothetical protein Lbru_2000 [Legionella brunensis]